MNASISRLFYIKLKHLMRARGSKPLVAIVNPSPITKDVSLIYAVGVPGTLLTLNNNTITVVAGDDDTSRSVSTVAIASSLGNGRVFAYGHDGFLTNEVNFTL